MRKVITYGTYDLLHYGHENLLRRAKALGDYLIVGVTTENFDKARGKLLVKQSLAERIAAVRATGFADEIILEEYEGQKIDDIKKYGIDVFAIGSDWKGKFDYLSEYCKVVYLPRTEGVSSTKLRNKDAELRIGVVGYDGSLKGFLDESRFVSGVEISGFYADDGDKREVRLPDGLHRCGTYDELLKKVNAVYIAVPPSVRPRYIEKAICEGKHVLTEVPLSLDKTSATRCFRLAAEHNVVVFPALKTAFSLAFQRLVLLLKSGVIGAVKSVDATCTSLQVRPPWHDNYEAGGGAFIAWSPTVLLPVCKILGEDLRQIKFISFVDELNGVDLYTKIQMVYQNAEATLRVGTGVKSEGDLIVSGTRGYIYVPAPWWKTSYFEIRKEDARENKRYFYQFEGEGIRYELAEFVNTVRRVNVLPQLSEDECLFISGIIETYRKRENLEII